MSDERFTIKPQDDYWAVVDNYNEDKVCIINGIHTEIEAIWLCDFMNEQQSTINLLLDLLYQSEETVINEYSSHIGEDMDKLDKIFKEKDIKEIERFVRGCDDE